MIATRTQRKTFQIHSWNIFFTHGANQQLQYNHRWKNQNCTQTRHNIQKQATNPKRDITNPRKRERNEEIKVKQTQKSEAKSIKSKWQSEIFYLTVYILNAVCRFVCAILLFHHIAVTTITTRLNRFRFQFKYFVCKFCTGQKLKM